MADLAMHGRLKIFTTTEEFNDENIMDEVSKALGIHMFNIMEEEYLYWYRRGMQPIEGRTKQVRKEINNKVCENHFLEIVTFKDGFFLQEPAYYKSRKNSNKVNNEVQKLNEYLYLSGKQDADNEVVDWFHTVGLGAIYVEASDDVPCKVHALDPRQAFVVYSRRPGNEPVMGVNLVTTTRDNKTETLFDVFTKDRIWHMRGTGYKVQTEEPVVVMPTEIIGSEANLIGEIPIIEYQYENNRLAAPEPVLTMLDALNTLESNALDGVEQFIQSLMIFYNCELGDDEEGNPITPSYIREFGAIFLKSIGQDKADLKILSEQLDQGQTQILKQNLYEQILHIVGMPAPSSNSGSTGDNVGAVIWRSGWYQAETYARNTEDLFRKANKYFDRIFLKILNLKLKKPLKLELSDFELKFNRNNTDNILTKTQAALSLRELGFAPEIAFARSGISNDPVSDVANSKEYIDFKWGKNADTGSDNSNQRSLAEGEGTGNQDREGQGNDNRVREETDTVQR